MIKSPEQLEKCSSYDPQAVLKLYTDRIASFVVDSRPEAESLLEDPFSCPSRHALKVGEHYYYSHDSSIMRTLFPFFLELDALRDMQIPWVIEYCHSEGQWFDLHCQLGPLDILRQVMHCLRKTPDQFDELCESILTFEY